MFRLAGAAVLLALVLLAGCTRGPDNAALRAAIQAHVRAELTEIDSLANTLGGDSAVAVLRALGAPAPADLRVADVTVLTRRRIDADDYAMKVRYDLIGPDTSATVTRDLLLARQPDGHWRALAHSEDGTTP